MREEKKGERRKMEIKKYIKLSREVVLVDFVLVPKVYMYLYNYYQPGYFDVVYRGAKQERCQRVC